MPEDPSPYSRPPPHPRRLPAHVRPVHLVLVAAATVVAAGLYSLRVVALPEPRPVVDGDRMKIQVVAPVEPRPATGSVMEVGDLVDGFEFVPPPRPVTELAAYAPYDEGFETPEPRPAPKRYVEDVAILAPPPPEPPQPDRRDGRAGRWFGFDGPGRDYRAEREARRARSEARTDQEREGRSVRWYRSDGEPADRPESRRGRDEAPPPDRWD